MIMEASHICPLCGKGYLSLSALCKHKRIKHSETVKRSAVKCLHCNEEFPSKVKLKMHCKIAHETKKSGNLRCPLCETVSPSYLSLRIHLAEKHSYTIKEHNLQFATFKDFENWKSQKENEGKCKFVRHYAARQLVNGEKRVEYFCHRSLMPRQSKSHVRGRKLIGSNKIGKACPAMMVLSMGDTFSVKYYSTHIGHQCDVRYLPHTKKIVGEGKLAANQENSSGDPNVESVLEKTVWKVQHLDDFEDRYFVEKTIESSHSDCFLKDVLTDSCDPVYKFVCADNGVHLNVTKNINLIDDLSSKDDESCDGSDENCVKLSLDSEQSIESLKKVVSQPPIECGDNDITSRCKIILDLCGRVNVNEKTKHYVTGLLDQVIQKLNDERVIKIHIEKDLLPHVMLTSENLQVLQEEPKFSCTEKNVITEAVSDENFEDVHIHSGFDHEYTLSYKLH